MVLLVRQSVQQILAVCVHHLDRSVERATLSAPFVNVSATCCHTLTSTLCDVEPCQSAHRIGRLVIDLSSAESANVSVANAIGGDGAHAVSLCLLRLSLHACGLFARGVCASLPTGLRPGAVVHPHYLALFGLAPLLYELAIFILPPITYIISVQSCEFCTIESIDAITSITIAVVTV